MKAVNSRLSVALALLITSCATLRHNDTEPIFVSSEPAGAEVTIRCDRGETAHETTPARLLIPRNGKDCVAEVTKAGYVTQRIPLERGYNAAFWSNFVPATALPAGLAMAFGGYDQSGAVFAVGVVGSLGIATRRPHKRDTGDRACGARALLDEGRSGQELDSPCGSRSAQFMAMAA